MLSLGEIARYHEDAVSALKAYFEVYPSSKEGFLARSPALRASDLKKRLDETALRSILITLASMEARFRLDFEFRWQNRLKDDLSRAFRTLHKKKKERVSLEEDVFETWKIHVAASKPLIGEVKTAFRLRHWLAHGRYWQPKIGREFDFEAVYDLAELVNEELLKDGEVQA